MRLFLGENLGTLIANKLRSSGFDVERVVEAGLRGCSDEVVFAHCLNKARVLLTRDFDFSNVFRFPLRDHPGIVICRYPDSYPLQLLARSLSSNLALLDAEEIAGCIAVLAPGSIRLRRIGRPPE